MIVVDVKQGTPEWHEARAGVITASMFKMIRDKVGRLNAQQQKYVDAVLAGKPDVTALAIAGYSSAPRAASVAKALAGEKVGEFSDPAKNYAFRLAVERISQQSLGEEGYSPRSAQRGQRLEEECRIRHENHIGEFVQLAGFVKTDDSRFGCSADSLVRLDGGGEYKCFISPEKVRTIVIDDDWGEVDDQVKGCMWIAEREWWDMCLYCPALKKAGKTGKDFITKRVQRDDDYIAKLEADLIEFDAMVNDFETQLRRERK